MPGSGESFRNKIPGLSLRLKSDSENNNISDVESRYFEIYEQKLNPFNEFSRVEKQRKLHDLSVADRIVLNTTIAFVSSQAGRRFVVVYISAMHIMVFFVLYYVTHFAHYGNCDPALPTQTLDILQ